MYHLKIGGKFPTYEEKKRKEAIYKEILNIERQT